MSHDNAFSTRVVRHGKRFYLRLSSVTDSVARTQQYKDSKGKGHLRFEVCVCITD